MRVFLAIEGFSVIQLSQGAAAIGELLKRAPAMEDFKMVSSRVGADGGNALAEGLSAGAPLCVGLHRRNHHMLMTPFAYSL